MRGIKLICVGKMREKYFISAFEEYQKRMGAYGGLELHEIAEQRLPDNPSDREIEAALLKEADEIEKQIPSDAWTVSMCIEGKELSSTGLAAVIADRLSSGRPNMCFIIGGSYGLSEKIKKRSDLKLSMSRMTFPHHLARVMLAEQIYRAFKINEGSKYHK